MRTVIAGGSGFLGRALARALVTAGHDVVTLTRRAAAGPSSNGRAATWAPDGGIGDWARELDGATAVVNLAGESIAGRRWSAAHKRQILESRVLATRSLVHAIGAAAPAPQVFISGSAVGYYGARGDEVVTEVNAPGTDFLARVCVDWEAEARAAEPLTRVAYLRTGLVLDRNEGALPQMLPPFWFGAGGPVGSGRQYWPWIQVEDWVDLVRFIIQTPAAAGALNATAPAPVTNKDFSKALGKVLHRPAFAPVPEFAVRTLYGQMAEIVAEGQRAVPRRTLDLGYAFNHTSVEPALRSALGKG